MRVNVSGKQFIFPRSCACCGAFPTTTLGLAGSEKNKRARTRGWVWDVPYCSAFKRHVRTVDYLLISLLGSLALAFLVGVAAGLTFGDWRSGVGAAACLLVAFASAGWLAYRLIRHKASVNCCSMTRAAAYLGSVGRCHSFDFKSGFYATDFVRANHRKLVNVGPQIVSIHRGTSLESTKCRGASYGIAKDRWYALLGIDARVKGYNDPNALAMRGYRL